MDRSVPWWVGALVAATVVLLAFQPGTSRYVEDLGSQVLAPVTFYVSGASASVSGFFSSIGSIGTLRQTVQQQSQEIERLNFELVRMRELEQENADLRNLLGFEKTQPGLQLLPVRMLGTDATGIVSAITIDKGSQDGVKEDMGVITWQGLAGTVIQVRPNSSSVLLVTDVGSSISAQVQAGSSHARGIVGGQKEGTLIMRDILQQESLQTGDIVTTLGVGGTLPQGLPIGRVLRVQKRTIDMFQEAILEPVVDMNNLDRLYVILSYPKD
ncbi:MAG: rod shape-determining protein MreC [Bacteroidetes bacterium]|nr:rod shape-determining protein MreC [Bacteroidota bacterium]